MGRAMGKPQLTHKPLLAALALATVLFAQLAAASSCHEHDDPNFPDTQHCADCAILSAADDDGDDEPARLVIETSYFGRDATTGTAPTALIVGDASARDGPPNVRAPPSKPV